jgi:hypothetical protein
LVIALSVGVFSVFMLVLIDLVLAVVADGLHAFSWFPGDAKGNLMQGLFFVFAFSSGLNMLGVALVFLGHDLRYRM